METVLGGKLVNRTAATVTLTELGAAILPHAQRILSVAQAAFSDMQQIVEAGGDGTVRIGLVPSVSSLLFPLLPQTLAEAFPRCALNFTIRPTMRLSRRCSAARLISASGRSTAHCPAELLVYPLREDPFVAVLHRDDPLAAQAHLPWKQLVGRDIAVFSKGNIQRLVAALLESHRLTLTTRYQVDYIETLYGLVRSPLSGGDSAGAVHHPSAGPGAQGRPPAAAGARPHSGPDARPAGAAPAY
ncbi:LysR substrate-binding domain-containing protein [Klebsiella pneumoniae subsp. pneumoniae]|nr:LysR substrate-binding domain-containing protein [Klebsiella pneumoniae subsp. pneumoniae]